MGYWDATDQILRSGGAPKCPRCGRTMYPADDHGRFICGCQGLQVFDAVNGVPLRTSRIPQVDTRGMTDGQKAEVAPINRLDSESTSAEKRYFELMAKGPDVIGTPEYDEACEELDRERGQG